MRRTAPHRANAPGHSEGGTLTTQAASTSVWQTERWVGGWLVGEGREHTDLQRLQLKLGQIETRAAFQTIGEPLGNAFWRCTATCNAQRLGLGREERRRQGGRGGREVYALI